MLRNPNDLPTYLPPKKPKINTILNPRSVNYIHQLLKKERSKFGSSPLDPQASQRQNDVNQSLDVSLS
jgi:hypothetical protein